MKIIIAFLLCAMVAMAQPPTFPTFTFTDVITEPFLSYGAPTQYDPNTGTWTVNPAVPPQLSDSYYQAAFGSWDINENLFGTPPTGFNRIGFSVWTNNEQRDIYGYLPPSAGTLMDVPIVIYVFLQPGPAPVPFNPFTSPDPRIDALTKIPTPWGLWTGAMPIGKFSVNSPSEWFNLLLIGGGVTYGLLDVPVQISGSFVVQQLCIIPSYQTAMLSRPVMMDL